MARTVLITGATSGIGRELAELFAADGCDVLLASRSEDDLLRLRRRLEETHAVRVRCYRTDLAAPSAAEHLYERLLRDGIEVDVLVNNAGFGVYGPFARTSMAEETAMLDLHVRNLTLLTKCVLPAIAEKRQGGILNVASTAAFQPGPFMAVYYATKSYVLSFTEALAGELAGTGVRVTALCPGPTATRFSARAGLSGVKLFAAGLMDARDVARIGYEGFKKGKVVVVPGLRNKLIAFSARLAPRQAIRAVVKRLHRQNG